MKKFLKNIKKYKKYAIRSAKSELKSEVADSRLNWLWWIIEPFCFMIIYTFVFGSVFKNTEPYFAAFIMIGLSCWDFFNRLINGSVRLIIQNRDLVTKIYIPKYILLLSKSITYVFKMVISLTLAFLLMIYLEAPLSWHFILVIPVLFVLYIITFGMGMILMHFGVTLNDLANLTRIILKMLFYISGVFYSIHERLGGILGNVLLKINPVAFCMNEARKVTVYGILPDFIGLGIWFIIGLVLCSIGVHMIHKYENSYAKVI